MSYIDTLTDADLEAMQPNVQAMEYAERLAMRLIIGEGKCPVRFAKQLLRLIHTPVRKPTLWQRIKRFLEIDLPPKNKNKISLDLF